MNVQTDNTNNTGANYAIRCQFDWENPISEGNIINIRTEIDYKFDWRVDRGPLSLLFTFLLELDPL